MKRKGLRDWLVDLAAITSLAVGTLATISFIAAKSPQQALRSSGFQMPSTWEAGVLNHGAYYQWLSIQRHPFLFALAIATMLAGGALLRYRR